jgi:hypothetical protein
LKQQEQKPDPKMMKQVSRSWLPSTLVDAFVRMRWIGKAQKVIIFTDQWIPSHFGHFVLDLDAMKD